jgi:putative acetyltransferase
VLRQIFRDAVRAIGPESYSAEQVELWAERAPDMERWCDESAGRLVFVAEDDSGVEGFTSVERDGHIDHLYVRPTRQGCGVGLALLRELEAYSAAAGVERLSTEASLGARPVFERAGFSVISIQRVEIGDLGFQNYRMEKLLALDSGAAPL